MTDSRARILVLIKGLGLGGAERLIADASRVWDSETFDYSVAYVLPWKDQLVGVIEGSGIRVTCIGGKRGLSPSTPVRLHKLISEERPAIVHAHLPSAGILARMSTGVPVVYTEHNIADSYREPTKTLNRLTYWRNEAVIAVSSPVAESLAGYPGSDPRVISNGISVGKPPREATSVRSYLGIGPNTPLVVHVGNIRPHKGHSNLIAMTANLMERVPELAVVSIGAEKTPGDLARVNEAAQSMGAQDHVRFLGRRDDARRFLAAADVVVNPSDFEGLPVTLLEALSYARPIVATDVGGVSEVVIDERTGLLVPPGDPVALAKAVERALTDPAAATWGEQGKWHVLAHHSIEAMTRAYEDVYREVLGV